MSVVISDRPYADWLTKSLGYLESQNIQKLAIVGIDEKNHEVITGYFDCTFYDKACMAANIQADALFDSVLANADKIVQQADDMNDDDDDDEI